MRRFATLAGFGFASLWVPAATIALAAGSPENEKAAKAPPPPASSGKAADSKNADFKSAEPKSAEPDPFNWKNGPVDGPLGNVAQIKVPAGYRFTGKEGARIWARNNGSKNDTGLGLIVPNPGADDFVVAFRFEDVGYIKDDEKSSIDADAILESIREGTKEQNKELVRMGMPTLEVVGWDQKPFYDEATHNLEWCLRGKDSKGEVFLNYNSKILGRKGVMSATLICDPKDLQAILPKYKGLLSGFAYNSGQSYAEYRSGDKIAEYGLTALVAGGATLAAIKTGLLGKLGKFIIYIVGGIIAAVVGFFKWLFGVKSEEHPAVEAGPPLNKETGPRDGY